MPPSDSRPFAQKVAMGLIKSPFGLKLSLLGRKKGAKKKLEGAINDIVAIRRGEGPDEIRIRVYRPSGSRSKLPIVIFFHGGGYATGWPERHHALFQRIMSTRPCIVVAPAFRSSLEAPYPAGHDDCYATLVWVHENADMLGGNANAIVLAGNSSGAGLAISTALRARDTSEIKPAFIMSFYAMVEDRSHLWTELSTNKITWTKSHNILAWHLLLRHIRSQKKYQIPTYATPAREENWFGMPPILGFVGANDILLAENVQLAERLENAGCDVTFRVVDNMFHAMEDSAPDTIEAQETNQWVLDKFGRMIDTYCKI